MQMFYFPVLDSEILAKLAVEEQRAAVVFVLGATFLNNFSFKATCKM